MEDAEAVRGRLGKLTISLPKGKHPLSRVLSPHSYYAELLVFLYKEICLDQLPPPGALRAVMCRPV